MSRRRFKPHINHNSEFELDLAPLLAVMVKLVPVLLVSSAFAQLMIIETELPQVIQQAIAREEKKDKPTQINLSLDKSAGAHITTTKAGKDGSNEGDTEALTNNTAGSEQARCLALLAPWLFASSKSKDRFRFLPPAYTDCRMW